MYTYIMHTFIFIQEKDYKSKLKKIPSPEVINCLKILILASDNRDLKLELI